MMADPDRQQSLLLKEEGQRLWSQVFSGAHSHNAATQACKSLQQLLDRALDEPFIDLVPTLLDCGMRSGRDNAQHVLELACKPLPPLSSDARQLQLAAWELIAWCCRCRLTAASQFMQVLLNADQLVTMLQEAIEAALLACKQPPSPPQQQQQQQQQLPQSSELPVSTQHTVNILCGITARQHPHPAWLAPLLPNLVSLLAVSQSPALVTELLLLFQAHCGILYNPGALQEQLGSLVSTIKRRRLTSDGAECLAARLAAGRLLGEAWVTGDPAVHDAVADMDMSPLVAVAEATHPGMGRAYNVVLWCMQMADHPGLHAHVADWLVARLPATIIFEANQANHNRAAYLVHHLPALQAARPDLMPDLLERGLLSAVACCLMPPDSTQVLSRTASVLGSASVLQALCDADPAIKAATLASTPVSSAFEWASRESGLPICHVLSQQLPPGTKPVKLGRLRVCAYEGCGKVECGNRVFKVCAACKERVATDPLSSEDMVAYYCGKECQTADRYAGHSYCVLEAIVKGDVKPGDRKRLLLCLGHPLNASKWHTIIDTMVHMDLASGAGMDRMRDDPSRAAVWISAGLGTQLTAFLAGLTQRPALDGNTKFQWGSADIALQACYKAIMLIKSLLAVLVPEETCHGLLPVRRELAIQLCRQLLEGQCEWLGVAFRHACASGLPIEGERRDLLEELCLMCTMALKFLEELGEASGAAVGGGPWAAKLCMRAYTAISLALSQPGALEVVAASAQKLLQELVSDDEAASHMDARALVFVLVAAIGRDARSKTQLRMRMARCKEYRASCALALRWGAQNGPDAISHFGGRMLMAVVCGQDVAETACKEGAEELLPALCALLLSKPIIGASDGSAEAYCRNWLIQALNMLVWFEKGQRVAAKGRWLLWLCSQHMAQLPKAEQDRTISSLYKAHDEACMLACMKGDPSNPDLAAAGARELLVVLGEVAATASGPACIRSCMICDATDQLMQCSRCRNAYFCSVACQKIAWPFHKRVCVKR